MFCRFSFNFKASTSSSILLILIFIYAGLSSLKAQEFYIHLEDSTYSPVWLNLHTIDSGYAHSGNYYSVADSSEQYGLGIESEFPEKYKNKNTWFKVEGWVKSNKIADKASFVTSFFIGDDQVLWQNFYFSELIKETEYWYYFSDSIKVPASVTKNGRFKAYLWNNDLKDTVAIDDLKVSFSELDTPSFIPSFNTEVKKESLNTRILLFENSFFKIYHTPDKESISIYSINDSLLINGFSYYIKNNLSGEMQTHHQKTEFKSVSSDKDGTRIKLLNKWRSSIVIIELKCNMHSPEIRFEVHTKHKKEQLVQQESIIIECEMPVDEVYRANRKSDDANIQGEYWLDKQGVQFGKNSETIIVYQTPKVSSLQLNAKKNHLWVNLDYERDHPFIHFPLREDTVDFKLDWSASKYNKGEKNKYLFSIYVGAKVNSLPRFMKNPSGYLATYIWTEHADFTNLRTNRATYFGSEEITNADSAIGGFIKYSIPVTKSVFYSNPDKVTNANVSNGEFPGLESSIKDDEEYFQFLIQIQKKDIEVCLHTPENFTTNKEEFEEALQFMQNEFNSPTWIDHGYNNGLQNNRENLVCDGTIKKSDYFSMDLWEKYGVRYFWEPFYEDYFTFDDWKFGALMTKPYNGFGDFFPNPDYWINKTRSGNLIHWPTKSALFLPNDELWEFNFSEKVLTEFVNSWGVEINHCYPAWVDPAKGFWVYDTDSTIVAAPGLNRTLDRIATYRNEGKLNVTTIKEFIDYQLDVEQVNYEILPDGRIKITNNSNNLIKGLSFATKANYVLVDDQIPDKVTFGDDLIFWFDIESKTSKLLRMIE